MNHPTIPRIPIPYCRIADACRITGLSQHYLRRGCRDGTIPHQMSGNTYYIDVPLLLEQLRESERRGV